MFMCFNWNLKSHLELSRTRHADAKGERSYNSSYSLTSAPDGGQWSASCPAVLLNILFTIVNVFMKVILKSLDHST
jgi:hypothetical protein